MQIVLNHSKHFCHFQECFWHYILFHHVWRSCPASSLYGAIIIHVSMDGMLNMIKEDFLDSWIPLSCTILGRINVRDLSMWQKQTKKLLKHVVLDWFQTKFVSVGKFPWCSFIYKSHVYPTWMYELWLLKFHCLEVLTKNFEQLQLVQFYSVSIHYLHIPFRVLYCSLSQQSLGKRLGTSWTGHQLVTRLWNRHKQPITQNHHAVRLQHLTLGHHKASYRLQVKI